MRGKKTNSENVSKIVIAKLSDPDKSLRDIASETGVNYQTVSDVLKDEGVKVLTSSDKAIELFDVNSEIIITASKKVLTAMKTMNPEYIKDAKTMQDIVETAFKQNQLIKGGATERIEIQELDESRKAIIANRFKNG